MDPAYVVYTRQDSRRRRQSETPVGRVTGSTHHPPTRDTLYSWVACHQSSCPRVPYTTTTLYTIV